MTYTDYYFEWYSFLDSMTVGSGGTLKDELMYTYKAMDEMKKNKNLNTLIDEHHSRAQLHTYRYDYKKLSLLLILPESR